MKALVIDDAPEVRMLLERILKDLKFEVTQASTGQDGLDKLKQRGNFDLAMVDIYMPEMNGHDFVKAARALPGHEKMKIIMVTTETDIAHISRALSAGANEYIMKPFSTQVIREKLMLIDLLNQA
jgi:two-component system, chemotaxis family, chemotaxis protein CheY